MAIQPPKANQHYFRYYLWAEGVLWKIPAKLHTALLRAELSLSKYANSQQKILEVEISKTPAVRVVNVRGTVYSFDSTGHLELSVQAEAANLAIESFAPIKTGEIVDIRPLLRDRYWQRTRIWSPTSAVKTLIKNHIEGSEPSTRIRALKSD